MVPVTSTDMTHVVGSASIWVLGQVAGPRREARVLHAGGRGIYLDLEGSCLALLAARAVQVPFGVRTMLPTLPGVAVGSTAVVHDGSIEVPGCEVLVTNIVDTTVPVLNPPSVAWGAHHLAELAGDCLDQIRGRLPEEALLQLGKADPAAVAPLLGQGEGLTPLGDDVLAGWLSTAVAARHERLSDIRSEVALNARERTSVLASTLLACAARGEGVPEFRTLLMGVVSENEHVTKQALELLMNMPDGSGAAFVVGCLLALQSAAG